MIKLRSYWLLCFALCLVFLTLGTQLLPISKLDQILVAVVLAMLLSLIFLLLFRPIGKAQFSATIRTINETKQQEIHQLTCYDALTHLPNRYFFYQQLESEQATKEGSLALLLIDIQDFKSFNELLGNKIGDELLVQVAKQLQSLAGHCLTARLGSDEFAILLPSTTQQAVTEVTELSQRILSFFASPVQISQHHISLQLAIGSALYPHDANERSLLIQYAHIALQAAKEQPIAKAQHYSEQTSENYLLKANIRAQLKLALQNNEFHLLYQPQVRLADSKIIGVEALIRWHNPAFKNLSPDVYIPIAEQLGLIDSIGRWAIEEAVSQTAPFIKHQQLESVSVNVSAWQLLNKDFCNQLNLALTKSELPAQNFCLELTETAFTSNLTSIKLTLNELTSLGVKIALDDFGKGQSSLARLSDLALHTLKVDTSFVKQLTANEEGKVLVKMILLLSEELQLATLAEGIETQAQLELLQSFNCQYGQGYYFYKPMPIEELSKLLNSNG